MSIYTAAVCNLSIMSFWRVSNIDRNWCWMLYICYDFLMFSFNFFLNGEEMKKIITNIQHQFRYCQNDMIHTHKWIIKTYQNWSFRLELGDPQREGAQSATKDFKDDFSVIFAAILQFIWLGFAHKVASSVK